MAGDKNSRYSSRLLILQAPEPISNPSLSARSSSYVDSINGSPFARTKTEAKSAVGFPRAFRPLDAKIAYIPPLPELESAYGIPVAGVKSSDALHPTHRVSGDRPPRRPPRQRGQLAGYQELL